MTVKPLLVRLLKYFLYVCFNKKCFPSPVCATMMHIHAHMWNWTGTLIDLMWNALLLRSGRWFQLMPEVSSCTACIFTILSVWGVTTCIILDKYTACSWNSATSGLKGSSNSACNHGKTRSNLLLRDTGAALLIPMKNNMALKISIDSNCC